jgi:sigma-B regulation protein RsbU (phosphoserine phosphatase)
LTVANAGASPPLLCRKGVVGEISIEGTPLGLLENRDYDSHSELLQSGDVVLLYSDGFQDQHNPQREEYGRARLGEIFRKVAHKPAQAIVNAVFSDLDRFAGGHPQFDDQTIVVLKVM